MLVGPRGVVGFGVEDVLLSWVVAPQEAAAFRVVVGLGGGVVRSGFVLVGVVGVGEAFIISFGSVVRAVCKGVVLLSLLVCVPLGPLCLVVSCTLVGRLLCVVMRGVSCALVGCVRMGPVRVGSVALPCSLLGVVRVVVREAIVCGVVVIAAGV